MRTFLTLVLIALIGSPSAAAQDDGWTVLQGVVPGARVKLSLAAGGHVTGTVIEVRDDAVSLRNVDTRGSGVVFSGPSGPNGERVVARSSVVGVTVAGKGIRYEATPGQLPDVSAARRAVSAMGVGRKIDVRTTRPQKLRGTITTIHQDGFTVSHGGSRNTEISYTEVTVLKTAGLHWAAKTAITAGVIYGSLGLAVLICYTRGACVS